MAFDPELAERVRDALAGRGEVSEKRMFGGLAFFVGGNMCCGTYGDGLLVRLGPEGAAAALAEEHVGPMEMGDRRMGGFVVVEPEGLGGDDLSHWVERGAAFAAALPPKA